jgi:hypothetical protein
LQILGLLDAGGMGEVYLAWHRTLACEVAVKVLPEALAREPAAVARFRLAIQAQARTGGHEHVVATMDAGEDRGRLYLVMEYIPGTDLKKYIKQQGPLPWREACHYVRQAALGLAHAHGQRIMHRDIKPANLLRTPDGKIKILDWGLARYPTQEALTQPGMLLGTPHYMSPEQAQDPTRVDPRSDLYSLGCTFYYLLTGQPPRMGDAGWDPRLGVPKAVVRVVEKLLAPQPEQRYASASALIEGLDRATGSAIKKWAALGAVALLFGALGVGLLRPAPSAHAPLPNPGPAAEVPAPPADALRIVALEIKQFRAQAGRIGTIGGTVTDSFAGQEDDDVRVQARLSAAAFCYLIAFNPDGKDQLCYPVDKTAAPVASAAIDYPADPAQSFPLNDGVGVQAFVLLAARQRLPPYAEWRARVGVMPWQTVHGPGVWRFDGQGYALLGVDRGEPRKLADQPKAFVDLCRFLQERPGIDALQALAFPVQPKDERNAPAPAREGK